MKPHQPRPLPPVQADLFSSPPAPLRSLQLYQDDLIELVSRLLWQVVHSAHAGPTRENRDEQDQP